MNVVLLAGGLGGARLAPTLARVLGPGSLTVVANVGDDLRWMGLRVCPDLDSITYALAGVWDGARGWGRRGETFQVRDQLAALGGPGWFKIGDRDLALHLARSRLLASGASLSEATREVAARLGVRGVAVMPASDELAPTRFLLRDGRTLEFQQWYVQAGAQPALRRTLLSRRRASRSALEALGAADAVVLGPSNPVTSIGAILALRGMETAVRKIRLRIAVSPVVLGRGSRRHPSILHHAKARRRVLEAAGARDRPSSIAGRYADFVDSFVLDRADAGETSAVRRLGMEPIVADLLDATRLARALKTLCSSQR